MMKPIVFVVISFLFGASLAAPVTRVFDAGDCSEKILAINGEIVVKMCDRVRDADGNLVEVEQKRIFTFDGQKKFEVMTIRKLFLESLVQEEVGQQQPQQQEEEEEANVDKIYMTDDEPAVRTLVDDDEEDEDDAQVFFNDFEEFFGLNVDATDNEDAVVSNEEEDEEDDDADEKQQLPEDISNSIPDFNEQPYNPDDAASEIILIEPGMNPVVKKVQHIYKGASNDASDDKQLFISKLLGRIF